MPKTAKAQNLHPKTLPFHIFQHSKHAKNSKSSKPTSQNVGFPNPPTFETCPKQQQLKTYIPKRYLSTSCNIRKVPTTAKAQNLYPKTLPFHICQHSQTCQKQQKFKTYIPKRCLSISSNIRNMPKTAQAQNLHPKTLPFHIFQHSQSAKNSKSSKPTSQNIAFPNLPTLAKCQNSKSSKPTSQNVAFPNLPTFANMPKTAKAQNLHPKTLSFQIFQNSRSSKPTSQNVAPNPETFKNSQKLKTYIPKRCLSKSSNIRKVPKTAKAQNLHPKTLPFHIFQHSQSVKNSNSSKPTSQHVAFPNLPTFDTCQKQQQLKTYIPKRCLSKSSNIRNMPKAAKAQTYIPKRCLSKSSNIRIMPKTAKAQNLHPKTLPFQTVRHSKHAKNSKNSKPTSQNVAFPNLPKYETFQRQQKLKTYIPKRCPKS